MNEPYEARIHHEKAQVERERKDVKRPVVDESCEAHEGCKEGFTDQCGILGTKRIPSVCLDADGPSNYL